MRGRGNTKGQEEYLVCVPPLKVRGKGSSEEDVTHSRCICMLFLWKKCILTPILTQTPTFTDHPSLLYIVNEFRKVVNSCIQMDGESGFKLENDNIQM